MTVAISAENFAGGFAGTALIAYMSSLTSHAFTATQYALFSSFYALPGKLLGGLSGAMVDWFAAHPVIAQTIAGANIVSLHAKTAGYVPFFICTASMGLPAILLIFLVLRREGEVPAGGTAPPNQREAAISNYAPRCLQGRVPSGKLCVSR